MGCWYETCGISGLPIPPKEKSLLFLLAPGYGSWRKDNHSGFSYPTSLWTPIVLPFQGLYNDDRGTIDLPAEEPEHWRYTKILLEDFRLQRVKEGSGDPQSISPAYTEDFFRSVERGWVTGKGHMGHSENGFQFPLGQMLVRRDVWDYLLAEQFTDGAWRNSSRELNHQHVREFVSYVAKTEPKALGFNIDNHFTDERRSQSSPFLSALFRGGSENCCSISHYRISLMYDIYHQDIDPTTALQILYDIADVVHVNTAMEFLRRSWGPQSGKGSQDIYYDKHARFHGALQEMAKNAE
jgi:hypothetical protein